MHTRRGFTALLVILFVLLIASVGVFAYSYKSNKSIGDTITGITGTTKSDSQVTELKILGVSDEVPAIETDLNKTNLEKINQELPQIDREASGGL